MRLVSTKCKLSVHAGKQQVFFFGSSKVTNRLNTAGLPGATDPPPSLGLFVSRLIELSTAVTVGAGAASGVEFYLYKP